jgi:hypothetical protein
MSQQPDPAAFVTPHKVALAILVRMYAQHRGESDEDGEPSELAFELALYLVEELKAAPQHVEKTLSDVLDDIEALGEGGDRLVRDLEVVLRDLCSPDDLFTFLSQELSDGVAELDGRIERNSIIDIFVRKVRLGFRAMTFERFCQLFERVVEYRDSATAEGAAAEGGRTPQAVPHLAACDLQAHVHRQARLLEESSDPLLLQAIGADIEQMMVLVDKVPKVLYLRFLHSLASRDFQRVRVQHLAVCRLATMPMHRCRDGAGRGEVAYG